MSDYAFNPITGQLDRVGTGGAGGDVSFTTDNGTVTGNNFVLEGQEYKDVPVMEVTNDLAEIKVANNSWQTAYVVDISTTDGEKGTFSTIQNAIDSAFANGDATGSTEYATIFLRNAGFATYDENLIFPVGRFHITSNVQGVIRGPQPVYIQGEHVVPSGAIVVFENVGLSNSTNPTFSNSGSITVVNSEVSGVGDNAIGGFFSAYNSVLQIITFTAGTIELYSCSLDTPSSGFLTDCQFVMQDCNCQASANVLALNGSTNGRIINCAGVNFNGTSVGNIYMDGVSLYLVCDLPNANIIYNDVKQTPESFITSYFTTSALKQFKKACQMGNTMKRRASTLATDTITRYDQYIALKCVTAATLTFDSTSVFTEQVWYLFDELGTAKSTPKTIAVDGGRTINGLASIVLDENYSWAMITYDGANYFAMIGAYKDEFSEPIGELAYFGNANGDAYLSGKWLKCFGQILAQADYPTLFSRIGLLNLGGSTWTTRTGASASNMSAAAASGTLAMFAGTGGAAQTSTNGIAWALTKSTGTASNIAALTYAGGKFVLGATNYIASSTDGNQWQTKNPAALAIGFGAKLFAAGSTGLVYTSTDGVVYDAQNSNGSTSYATLAYGGGKYLIAGNGNGIATSTDAITWAQQSPGVVQNFSSAEYGNGIFMLNNALNVITSTDGITWTNRVTGSAQNLLGFDFGAGLWVAAGVGGVMRNSTDAITWAAGTSGTALQINTVKFLNSLFLYGGAGGVLGTSTDGLTWTARTSNTASVIMALTYGAVYVYSTNAGGLGSSTDGITWTARTSGVTTTISSLTYDGVHYIGVGVGFQITSTDAITWTVNTAPTASNVLALGYGASTYVAMGAGGMALTSTDALTWTPRTTGSSSSFLDVTYANSLFVACGQGGQIYSSTDAITWTPRTSGTSSALNAIEYTDRYVVGGVSGALYTSTNAITWIQNTSMVTINNTTIVGLTYANNILIGIGLTGFMFRSDDSINFYAQNSATISTISITNAFNLFMVSGNPGTSILTSPTSYGYNSATSFQIPTDAGLGIVTEIPTNFKRSLYIKAL